MRLRHLVPLLALALSACQSSGELAVEPAYYSVRAGDTIYSIAWRYQKDPNDLIRWNQLAPPHTIHIGDRLQINGAGRGQPSAQPEQTATAVAKKPAASAPKAKSKPKKKPAATTARTDTPPTAWAWPTRGKILQRFDPKQLIQGIDIAGQVGGTVRAAHAGEVVYSGEGLSGHNYLIILKHSDAYLSAYANNKKLLIKEGERVATGQKIAQIGQNNHKVALLHFEIRKNGTPVDPLQYLPK